MINCASEYLPVQVFRPFGRGKVNSLVHFYARSRMFSVAVSQTNPLCFGLPNTSVDCVVSTLSNFILHRIVKIRQSPVKNNLLFFSTDQKQPGTRIRPIIGIVKAWLSKLEEFCFIAIWISHGPIW